MARTTFVLWYRPSCKDYAAPHVASRERCAVPHVVHDDRRAALDAVSYPVLPEPLVLQWSVPERLVMAVPEPQHLTL